MTEEDIYKKLVEEAQKKVYGFTEFDGQNCDDCLGWDGWDSRCQCGNRRVYWELSEDKTYVSAVAY